jgi:hypothetical protein
MHAIQKGWTQSHKCRPSAAIPSLLSVLATPVVKSITVKSFRPETQSSTQERVPFSIIFQLLGTLLPPLVGQLRFILVASF